LHAGQSSDTYGATSSSYQASSASTSYQAPTSYGSTSYTVPIYSTTEPGGGKSLSPSKKSLLGDKSKGPSLPANVINVKVQIKHKKSGDLHHFYYNDNHYTISKRDWVEFIREDKGERYDCFAYWTSGLCFYTWDLSNPQEYKEAFTSSPQASASDYQAPASTQALDSSGQDTQQGPTYIIVKIRVVPHTTRKDEIIFKNAKGNNTSTLRSEWVKIEYNREIAWQYTTKRHTYITYDERVDC